MRELLIIGTQVIGLWIWCGWLVLGDGGKKRGGTVRGIHLGSQSAAPSMSDLALSQGPLVLFWRSKVILEPASEEYFLLGRKSS